MAVDGVDFSLERRSATSLHLRYEVKGRIGELVVPARAAPIRTDNLWKTTCFELFLRRARSTAYRELNFSPSSRWAAYEFSAHRRGMVQAALPAPPVVEVTIGAEQLNVDVRVSLDLADEPYLLAAAAVIEEKNGRLSLWALSHAGAAPDFHHPDCFRLELPPAPAP
jgi:hypothetical protein